MAQDSSIEWTDHTFNPWIGCTKVSPGCLHCYAETQDNFRGWTTGGWGRGKPRTRTSAAYWRQPETWNRKAEATEDRIRADLGDFSEYSECTYQRPRVFCASLADWLDDEVPLHWLADLLDLIQRTPALDWLLLTKRPHLFTERVGTVSQLPHPAAGFAFTWAAIGEPPANVWAGVSAEDQIRWNERVPLLFAIPAGIRFVSAEPLLGAITVGRHRPDWLIVGGESGPGARPIEAEWVTSLRDQAAPDVAFFFKQWGGPNKKAAGRLLEGVLHDTVP